MPLGKITFLQVSKRKPPETTLGNLKPSEITWWHCFFSLQLLEVFKSVCKNDHALYTPVTAMCPWVPALLSQIGHYADGMFSSLRTRCPCTFWAMACGLLNCCCTSIGRLCPVSLNHLLMALGQLLCLYTRPVRFLRDCARLSSWAAELFAQTKGRPVGFPTHKRGRLCPAPTRGRDRVYHPFSPFLTFLLL